MERLFPVFQCWQIQNSERQTKEPHKGRIDKELVGGERYTGVYKRQENNRKTNEKQETGVGNNDAGSDANGEKVTP